MSTSTFTLSSSSGEDFYFPYPEWGSPDNKITKDIQLFNMWSNSDIELVDKGINNQPLKIGGTICICDIWEGICMDSFCMSSLCFSQAMTAFLDSFNQEINAGEKFTINELGGCLNGVYVVKNFRFDTIKRVPSCFRWELELERVGDI